MVNLVRRLGVPDVVAPFPVATRRVYLRRRGVDGQGERIVLKILGWAVVIIFVIGLLVVFGIFDLIF